MPATVPPRRYPAGAEPIEGGVSFRVWAPDHDGIELILDGGGAHAMGREPGGYFSIFLAGLGAEALYRYRLSGKDGLLPDPASRFQPRGVDGPSQVIDPAGFQWHDQQWRGLGRAGQVFYEMHVGTFTREGTWAAATARLETLGALGITAVELMPLHEYPGTFGWGYDGVLPYAPTRNYGTPDDFRRFVERAHGLGLGVIHDVVYNHFGADEVCPKFAKAYLSDAPPNDWGLSINFDGPDSGPVRDYFAFNAACWIEEYHLDGIRIDATQALLDKSEEHIIVRIARECRSAAGQRNVLLISENEPQEPWQVRPAEQGGYGLDALWNDDFHHSAWVALTSRNEAYYHDHRGTPQELLSALKYGYLFQGQRYDWQNFSRGGTALDLEPCQFVHFLQNHDQIANTAAGVRVGALVAPARMRAMTALLLLGPQTPLLFQGQEFGASTPFHYFLDSPRERAAKVRDGRLSFLRQFPSTKDPDFAPGLAEPSARETFEASKLDWSEFERHEPVVALHRDLLSLRRNEAAFVRQGAASKGQMDGSVLGPNALLLRFFGARAWDDRLLIVNLGPDLPIRSIPDPLSAPPEGAQWVVIWSSERPAYGGHGQRPVDLSERWVLTAETAIVLAPAAAEPRQRPPKPVVDAWQRKIGDNE